MNNNVVIAIFDVESEAFQVFSEDADLGPRVLVALDYVYENSDDLADTIAGVKESAKLTLQDTVAWFVGHVRSELPSF